MYQILRDADLQATSLMPRKDESMSDMHQILRDPDLHAMLSMPWKDESVGAHALTSKRSRLTSYVVNASKR